MCANSNVPSRDVLLPVPSGSYIVCAWEVPDQRSDEGRYGWLMKKLKLPDVRKTCAAAFSHKQLYRMTDGCAALAQRNFAIIARFFFFLKKSFKPDQTVQGARITISYLAIIDQKNRIKRNSVSCKYIL